MPNLLGLFYLASNFHTYLYSLRPRIFLLFQKLAIFDNKKKEVFFVHTLF